MATEAERLDVREASVLLWLTNPSTWWDGIGPNAANRPVDHLGAPELVLEAFRSTFEADW